MRSNKECIILLLFLSIQKDCAATNLAPSFSLDMNNFVLPENTNVGEVVYRLEGSDPENSPVHFSLFGTDLLEVDSDNGQVKLVKPLDREINDTLNFFVSIRDEVKDAPVGGDNVVTIPVTIIVLDVNDNAPIFQNVPYNIEVKEDTPINTTIFNEIIVTDVDTVGETLEVECVELPEYLNACESFKIKTIESDQNKYLGEIVLKDILDYSIQSGYAFLLKASDSELENTTLVNITIRDVQNTPPKFYGSLEAEVYEDVPINTLVMTVHAEDGDRQMPRKIMYELVNNPMNYFLLDAVTGELRTAKPLDREALDNRSGVLKFNIRARELVDGNKIEDPSIMTTVEATVTIKDVNDEPPSFNQREYSVEISEDIAEGSPLPGLNMIVKDPDLGNNSIFSLTLQDISGVFSVEPKTAKSSTNVSIIVTNSSLDYEDPNQRQFIILVIAKEIQTDLLLSSTATVKVTVTDANDNAPTFDQDAGYTAVISEMATGSTLVTTIVARDRDSGRFGEGGIVYQLVGNGAEKFIVNERTGAVTVKECETPGREPCLDFEIKPEYFLQFKATDDDGKGQTSLVPLKITLMDQNDNPPMFTQPVYRVFINEGASKFDPEVAITARDMDKTSKLIYSIIAGNDNDLFKIDSNTGKLKVSNNKGLDLTNDSKTNDNIVLTIEANDGKFTTTTMVNITIKDVNNNNPIFEKENYLLDVAEDVLINTSVLKIKAHDADVGLNAEIRYKFQKGSFEDFSINNESGVVTVSSKLDYDRRKTYHIEVVATDLGEPSLTGTTTLIVNIINTNDKLPYFVPTTQKTEVMENAPIGSVIYTLIALDQDVNTSESLNFAATEPITALDKFGKQILDNEIYKEFFSVDKNTGKVIVMKELDRDVAAVIRITILVTDITAPTLQQGEGILIITVSDVNDSPPFFVPPWRPDLPFYHLDLKEELRIGTIVATYIAHDEDSDIAGYVIDPPSEYFEINYGTGIVQIKKEIDYEKIKSLNFTVIASDTGVPQLNSSATVIVSVKNINDNDPIFSQNEYNVSINENSPVGTPILTVKATDLDADEFGVITYNLIGEHSENFVINPRSGLVTVGNKEFLDHEIINETTIQVVAVDGAPGNLKRSSSVPIHIQIIDINDNAPKFNQSHYNAKVIENVRLNPPTPILQVHAIDNDVHSHIRYKIVEGNKDNLFLLSDETGVLYPHKSLIGNTNEFNLIIEASDGEGSDSLSDKATVNIKVMNVNEHKPKFILPALQNSTLEITENSATTNYLVLTVKAFDKDIGENGRLTYHLRVNDENVQETEEFSIDEETGELRSKKYLDREVKGRYELILVAKDHGNPLWYETLAHLTIFLVDMNDNRPEFPDSQTTNPYVFYVIENGDKNEKIGQVKALDRDEGQHAKVYYYLLWNENDNKAFYIDKNDGGIYTNKSFDRETKDEYDLYIFATNDDEFYLIKEDKNDIIENEIIAHNSSIAKVKIIIKDLNDNIPKFEQNVYYTAVNAMANINDFITNVTAIDNDEGLNGTLKYFIKASNLYKYGSSTSSGSIIPSPFNITQNGQLNTATYLAENNQHRFIVDVIAREVAFPEREATTKVHVWIFEPNQLIRIILSKPVEEVLREKNEILAELSNATQSRVIMVDIRFNTDDMGHKNEEWSDMYILVVDPSTHTILPVPDVLKVVDAKYDFLKDYYSGFAIENVLPALIVEKEDVFDPALAALIALLIVLFVGVITFIVVCCCLRHWAISPNNLKKKDALIKKAIIDDLNTTENPLWIEQKLKIYEEQELTMQVFNEPENGLNRRDSDDLVPDDNTYATIQHPNRRGSSHVATLSMGHDDMADYATLSGVPHHSISANSSLRGAPNFYEAAMGFQGSTFQVPEHAGSTSDSFDDFRTRFKGSGLTINNDGQPEFVAELIFRLLSNFLPSFNCPSVVSAGRYLSTYLSATLRAPSNLSAANAVYLLDKTAFPICLTELLREFVQYHFKMTKSFWIFGTICLLVLKVSIIDAKLELIGPDDPNIDFVDSASTVTISMDEENQGDVIIAHIIQDQGTNTPEIQFIPASDLEVTGMKIIESGEEKKFNLVVTKRQDFESEHKSFVFDIWDNVDELQKQVNLKIRNIDDNVPFLTSNDLQCSIKEAECCDTGCEYLITDDDREMGQISWLINGELTDERFEFEEISKDNLKDNEMAITLKLRKKLVYGDGSFYIINLSIKDTVHTTDPTRIAVTVTDVPNLPPVWVKIFQSKTFEEELEQEFQVEAKDGDIGIDTKIYYQLNFDQIEDWNSKVSIHRDDGKISVAKLDRDEENRDIYTFKVKACEEDSDESEETCIEQEIIFILSDINDNRPIFTIDPPSDITEENIIYLELLETTASTISTKINLNDIDTGINARYSLKLSGYDNEVDHKSAFSVAPESGYQETSVDFLIINYLKLDYEKESWRTFSLTLTATESADPINDEIHKPITFHITLLNRNDELPNFIKCNEDHETKPDDCVIRIEETYNDTEQRLIQMQAEDLDVDGTLTYAILGTYANQILKIDDTTGEIYLNEAYGRRPFDYESQEEVIVQVQVKDGLETDKDTTNIALSQLTIKLKDVNDETPRISVEASGDGVPENCGTQCDIGITITATDEDSDSKLEITIKWDESSAIKNGRKVTDSEEFAKYKECVKLVVDPTSFRSRLIATLQFIETEETMGNTPDFEIFDTLDLKIVATDINQIDSETPNYVSTNVQIYINDINDNEPIFPEDVSKPYKFRATEKTETNTLIGYITATDADVDAKLSYSIKPKDDNPNLDGLVKIDEKDGKLTTTDKKIDADTEKIFKLYYTVTVSDEVHIANAEVEIDIEDINDQDPIFEVDETIDDVPIAEQSEAGTPVAQFLAFDGDRDEVNNKITYSFSSNMDKELRNYFKIDEETGEITVAYTDDDQKLDRDNDIPKAPIIIHIDARDPGNRVDSISFRVILTDINNNEPVLLTKGPFSIGEDSSAKQFITELKASDADEGDNSKVSFEIVGDIIGDENLCNKEDKIEFSLTEPNETERTVKLLTGVKLVGFLNDYKVTVKMTDHGNPAQSSEATFTVNINKYNFNSPVITSPQEGATIHLALNQSPGNPIQLLDEGKTLSLEAHDDQCGKYRPTFSVQDDKNLFTVTSSGYLTIQNNVEYDENVPYQATIIATTVGEPSDKSSQITVTFFFVNYNINPVFDDENREAETNGFHENKIGEEFEFPKAKYEVEIAEDLGLPIYYIIIEGQSLFSIPNNQKPIIRLDNEVDYETTPVITVVVQASNRESGEIGGSDRAKITITVNVQDINDNPPEFEREIYYTTLKYDDKKDDTLIQVKATDPDVTDVISYVIEENDDYPSNYPKLYIDNNGALKLISDSNSAATGYTTVTIWARDCVESGSLCDGHKVSANVEIYVVNEDKHIVKFKFKNVIIDVENKKDEIADVLSETFKNDKGTPYQANIKRAIEDDSDESSKRADDDESETSTITTCEIYFIDTDSHEPVEKSVIESFASDVKTYDKLQQDFTQYGLILISFSSTSADVDNTVEVLRAWLIGVAVILGVLCILLIVAFVLKTRSLTKRLNKLSVTKFASQESGLNRKVVPNTNRHALEGSNPVFSSEKELPEEADRQSISSGDSDLIGVENNPDFERKIQSNGVERY
ncbi:cadherin-87A [Onthophagus taurus]|uniref:cadherin-87A n=1 Tax=Onthophagus taurus TaxID=166361 RepID=UPI0039BDF759